MRLLGADGLTIAVLPLPGGYDDGTRKDLGETQALRAGTIVSMEIVGGHRDIPFRASVTPPGGGGSLTIDNVNVAAGERIIMTSFVYTRGKRR